MAKTKRKYGVSFELTGKDKASATFAKVRKVGIDMGKAFARPVTMMRSVTKGIGGFLQAVPGLQILGSHVVNIGQQIKGLAVDTANFADTLDNLRNHTGISAGALQEVAFAAGHAGVNFNEFQAAVQRMSATIGRGVTARQLVMLGRGAGSFTRALKGAKTPGERFEVVLNQMASIEDTSKRAAFGMLFFGRSGVKLAAAAGAGADALADMRKQAREMGLVMSDEEIAKADKFADTWANLGMMFETGKRDFGMGLIDGLLPALEELLGTTKDNRKEIGDLLKDLGRDVGKGIIDAAKWTVEAVKWLSANGGTIIKVAEKVGYALAAFAALRTLGVVGTSLGGLLGGGKGVAGAIGAAGVVVDKVVSPVTAGAGKVVAKGAEALFPKAAGAGGWLSKTLGFGGNVLGKAAGPVSLLASLVSDDVKERRAAAGGRAAKDAFARAKAAGVSVGDINWAQYGSEATSEGSRTSGIQPEFKKVEGRIQMSLLSNIENATRLATAKALAGGGPTEPIAIEITVNDKGGNVDGPPKVKSTAPVKTTVKGNVGRRTQSHWDSP